MTAGLSGVPLATSCVACSSSSPYPCGKQFTQPSGTLLYFKPPVWADHQHAWRSHVVRRVQCAVDGLCTVCV